MVRVAVTGMGAISALGFSVAGHREFLATGQSAIQPIRFSATVPQGIKPAAEVALVTDALREKMGLSDPALTRTNLLALHAATEAIADAGLSPDLLRNPRTALVVGTTVGGMCLTDNLHQDAVSRDRNARINTQTYEYSHIASSIRAHFGMSGKVATINTACSSSANAILFGARLIRAGLADRVLVGGSDSLAKFTLYGFNALRLLSDQPCRPFDKDRNGLTLGEGAAFLVLSRENATASPRTDIVLSGYGNACDAYHPTSLSEEANGPSAAMREALRLAALQPQDIGFVNAHGTATENNDLVESQAMVQVLGRNTAFGSTKATTGHTLGAAGALEAVISLLSLRHQEWYPSLHFQSPISETGLVPVTRYQSAPLQHVMSNSFGFGGNCTSLIFSRI